MGDAQTGTWFPAALVGKTISGGGLSTSPWGVPSPSPSMAWKGGFEESMSYPSSAVSPVPTSASQGQRGIESMEMLQWCLTVAPLGNWPVFVESETSAFLHWAVCSLAGEGSCSCSNCTALLKTGLYLCWVAQRLIFYKPSEGNTSRPWSLLGEVTLWLNCSKSFPALALSGSRLVEVKLLQVRASPTSPAFPVCRGTGALLWYHNTGKQKPKFVLDELLSYKKHLGGTADCLKNGCEEKDLTCCLS